VSDVPILVPPVELTAATVSELKVLAQPHAAAGPGCVIDLFAVTFVSSAGLAGILQLGRQLAARGATLTLARSQGQVLRVLKIVGMEQVVPMFASVEAAAAHVRRSGVRT
jgi:anti-anti-sigma factor